ncbi:zinc finger protein 226-like [Periplaneta americana]|uniref:zinc finger protein 226-like n=1 Tax=Periplaneta americana TaxID=6978 RepID=UPI0037E96EC4
MDVIKKEDKIDISTLQSDDVNKGERLFWKEENQHSVGVNFIKVEPSGLAFEFESDMKCEENEVPISSLVLKSEVEEQSWSVDPIKEELISDVTINDGELTDRDAQQHFIISSHENDISEKTQHFSDMAEHKHKLAEFDDIRMDTSPDPGTKTFKCNFCDKSFTNPGLFESHISSHSIDKSLNSDVTQKSSGKLGHQHVSRGKNLKCETCHKSFTLPHHLRQHAVTHEVVKSFKCEICDKNFARIKYLRQHATMHTGYKPFKCKTCHKCFTTLAQLQRHELTHTGDKPFKCGTCEKSFSQPAHLQRHVLTHTSEKPFKCETCDKSFKEIALLRRHVKTHIGARPLKCDICGKNFALLPNIRRHMLTHISDKPFKCEICEKSFAALPNLQRHKFTHIVDKPFKCENCGKGFSDVSNLRQHSFIHSNNKPFKCNICDKSFVRVDRLRQHELIHINDEPFSA